MYHKGLITPQIDESQLRIVTESELNEHKVPGNLWLAVKGIVYDVSNFRHQGGQWALTQAGGTDCTSTFTRYHASINCAALPGVVTIGKLQKDSESKEGTS
ncbi:MAG: hypothetical protein EZS28_015290 [Streblomastix strix]|uniref:Cytochrome b5 heme-binding domain-containing protein n=1 Tax=Streblomastix strix TaxID=222440 RepID=A0A5J4W3V0_9EUKA|nr:MAG: hypothetical protein EZS28_015290 [Streblomastix strix]